MRLTRRELMHAAAVAGTALLPALPLLGSAAEQCAGVTLLLDGDDYLARESAAGYKRALRGMGDARTIIVPAISTLSLACATALRAKVQAGRSVILESALTFTDDTSTEQQCRIIRDLFGFPVEWPQEQAGGAASYIQYRWPVDALVRSFGQPVYIRNDNQRAIAHHPANRIVAARKSMGDGEVVFLGSPLGPLLLAEDREATLLVRRMIAECV